MKSDKNRIVQRVPKNQRNANSSMQSNPIKVDLVMDEIIDEACLLEIKDMKDRILRMATGFTSKDLYNYEIKMRPTNFYRLLSECEAICQVFRLEEFSIHHFNLAAQKLKYPKLIPNQLSKATIINTETTGILNSDEQVLSVRSEDVNSNEEADPPDVSVGQRVITLLANVVAPVIVAFIAITLLKDYMEFYKDWYTPVIIGVIIMLSSTITITSWHVKEFTFMRNIRMANKKSNDGK